MASAAAVSFALSQYRFPEAFFVTWAIKFRSDLAWGLVSGFFRVLGFFMDGCECGWKGDGGSGVRSLLLLGREDMDGFESFWYDLLLTKFLTVAARV